MSVGHLLNNGLKLEGSYSSLEFSRGTSSTKRLLLQFKPYCPGQNIYWLSARLTSRHAILAMSSVTTVDYDIMHRRFAHPSKDVLRHASGNTQNFPSNMSFPSNDPVCQGCAEGKMTRSSFPPSQGRSKASFDKIHMDLKEFSVQSYNNYKFFILFFDDCTSFGWIVLLRHKSEADPAIRQFIAMVKNQFNKVIHEFMIDAGGEFKSEGLRTFLKELGINTLTSVPHMHQQNGRAERFIQTIVEKAQAIRLEACIPQNWWEFAVNYAVHVYNRTPLKHSSNDYKTPFERLHRTKPDVAHLRVFGCGAYVFLPEDV
jgi:GAG-pre-integrase domain